MLSTGKVVYAILCVVASARMPPLAAHLTGEGSVTGFSALARRSATLLVAAGILTTCAGDHDPGAGTAVGGAGAAAAPAPRVVAQPSANTPAAAFPVVEDLVIEATDLANQLFQNPSVVDDRHGELLTRFGEIYTPDSPTPAGVVAQLKDLNAQGRHYRAGPSGKLRDVGVYRMTRIDGDQVAFRVCAVEDVEIVEAGGKVVGRRSQVTQGDGWAERTAGVWRFAGIDPDETATLRIAPGSAPSGFCDTLLGGTRS
jgi:hypothetical protein